MSETQVDTWLLEQVAADERVAAEMLAYYDLDDSALWVVDDDYKHNVIGIPKARVLAECGAKRRIIALHSHTKVSVWQDRSQDWEACDMCGSGAGNQGSEQWPCDTLKLLALPYADRPGYREEWRP